MKITRTGTKWATASCAGALTLLALPMAALAGGHGMGGSGGRAAMADRMGAGRGRMEMRVNHDVNDDRGARRAGADDRAGHDANDDRSRVRDNRADDPAGHDANDDNNRHRRGRGGR